MTIIWDWNGTLLDDAAIAVETDNEIFRRYGIPLLTMEHYRRHFRHPVADFYEEVGVPRALFPKLAEEWSPIYERLCQGCALRKGSEEAVRRLHEAGFHQAIVSASPVEVLRRQVAAYPALAAMMEDVEGLGDAYGASKVALAKGYLARKGVKEAVFIGDTTHDAEVARAAGCPCLMIQGGHQALEVMTTAGAEVFPDLDAVLEKIMSM